MHLFELIRSFFFFAGYMSSGNKSFKRPLSAKEERLYIQKCIAGDESAREVLIEHNMRLVAHIAKKYGQSGVEMEDLISIGTIGLIKGINTFSPEKSNQLAIYIARCIENEILMYLRADKKNNAVVSLGDSIGEDKEGNKILLMDILNASENEVSDQVELRMQISQMASAIASVLNEREKTVIMKRYGLNGRKPLPQRELAKELGISRSYVSRIEKKALYKLKSEMNRIGLSK